MNIDGLRRFYEAVYARGYHLLHARPHTPASPDATALPAAENIEPITASDLGTGDGSQDAERQRRKRGATYELKRGKIEVKPDGGPGRNLDSLG